MRTLNEALSELLEANRDKKYEITNSSKVVNGHKLYMIRALQSFKTCEGTKVSHHDHGGWIESEDNLSHEGTSWVDFDSCVYDGARIEDDAFVCDNATVCGNAKVGGTAVVMGWNTVVSGDVEIGGNAQVDYSVDKGKIMK